MRALLSDRQSSSRQTDRRSTSRSDKARLKELERRYRARQPARGHRLVAGTVAVLVNLAVIAVLGGPGSPYRGFGKEPREEPLTVFLVSAIAPVLARPPLTWSPPRLSVHIAAPQLPALFYTASAMGPPTETVAAVSDEPDRDARVVDSQQVQQSCLRAYPNEFTANEGSVTLRIYVMADGRIGQGVIIGSSGDGHLDWMTLKCIQAYAHLNPGMNDGSEVGSWQRLTWNWSER